MRDKKLERVVEKVKIYVVIMLCMWGKCENNNIIKTIAKNIKGNGILNSGGCVGLLLLASRVSAGSNDSNPLKKTYLKLILLIETS